MTEFNLSEKSAGFYFPKSGKKSYYSEEDVKEFIRLLKEKGKCKNPSQNREIIYLLSEKEIDELAGDKLK
jgi:hypothetical protein